jgi:3-oxoisoapionate kinase
MTRLITFYGDDFTGSTDVMEALASHGVKTILFTRQPDEDEFRAYQDYHAVGLAGSSRSQTPAWMDEHLPPAFSWLKSLGARFCHYKVCSTFDSSPTLGSIGRALEIGQRIFDQSGVPLIIGAPQLKRYTFAGHLFADYQGRIYRIDRHPVMSRHPVTPMDEADLRLHLARQTSHEAQLTDVHDQATQLAAGQFLLQCRQPFVIGSSGVEYALLKALKHAGEIDGSAQFAPVAKADRLLVISGSVSPTTQRQIQFAAAQGFALISADPARLMEQDGSEISRVSEAASTHLAAGVSPVIFTAMGPATDLGSALGGKRHMVGGALGKIARRLVLEQRLSRLVVAGGDTSSHALGQLPVLALSTRFPLRDTPGSPLCASHSEMPEFAGLEIALKGGQVGGDDYFTRLRDGFL